MILDIFLAMVLCALLGAFTLMLFIGAWSFFEDTELWEILKDKITRKEE